MTLNDIPVLFLLAFLEGILSLDNALVLALLAKPLPKAQQKKALTYGLVGAVVFRLIAVGLATYLIHWNWVKYLGGGYLVWIAVRHLWTKNSDAQTEKNVKKRGFWETVFMIELMDIAFAVDSILAAVALSPKFIIVFLGGFMGVILVRFAASMFIGLLSRFPNFESSAYALILIIGSKLILDALHLPGIDFHSAKNPAPWIFWGLMLFGILIGFRPTQKRSSFQND